MVTRRRHVSDVSLPGRMFPSVISSHTACTSAHTDPAAQTFLSPVSSGSSSSKTGDFSVYLIVNIKSIIIH